jgi:hypothetical protein
MAVTRAALATYLDAELGALATHANRLTGDVPTGWQYALDEMFLVFNVDEDLSNATLDDSLLIPARAVARYKGLQKIRLSANKFVNTGRGGASRSDQGFVQNLDVSIAQAAQDADALGYPVEGDTFTSGRWLTDQLEVTDDARWGRI